MNYRDFALAQLQDVRTYAKANGFTDQFIADKIGYTRANVSRMFSGKHLPRLDTFLQLCVVVKYPIGDLFKKLK